MGVCLSCVEKASIFYVPVTIKRSDFFFCVSYIALLSKDNTWPWGASSRIKCLPFSWGKHSRTHTHRSHTREGSGIFSSVSFWQFCTPTCTYFSLLTRTLWMLSSCSTCYCAHLFKDPSWLFNEKDFSWLNGTTDTHRAKVQTALWIFNSCRLMNVSTASCWRLGNIATQLC